MLSGIFFFLVKLMHEDMVRTIDGTCGLRHVFPRIV